MASVFALNPKRIMLPRWFLSQNEIVLAFTLLVPKYDKQILLFLVILSKYDISSLVVITLPPFKGYIHIYLHMFVSKGGHC